MAVGTTTYRGGAHASELAATLAAEGFEVGEARPSTLVVLDTFDGRLATAGCRLTASATDDGRTELVLTAAGGTDAVVTVPALPSVAGDLPLGPLRARLADLLEVRVLLPLLTTTVLRSDAVRRDGAGKVVARAAVVDGVAVATGTEVTDGPFLELTELAGYPDVAALVRERLEQAGAEAAPGGVTELAAAAAGVDLGGVRIEPGIALEVAGPAIDGYRAVLANLRDAIVANEPGTIADIDPEFLHDLRVAVRRTRAVLANAKGVIPAARLEPAREEFAWLGHVTGPARDLDVYQIEWPNYVDHLPSGVVAALEPIRENLADQRVAAHASLSAELGGRRATELIAGWSAWLDGPIDLSTVDERGHQPLDEVVAKRIRRAHHRMIERGRSIGETSPADELHELRKDAKKLRYLLECFGGLYEPAARKQFVKPLKSLQDNLGEHQDAEVHVHQLDELAVRVAESAPVSTAIAAGRLIERMEQRRAEARAEFAERFDRFDSAVTRDALAELLDTSPAGSTEP